MRDPSHSRETHYTEKRSPSHSKETHIRLARHRTDLSDACEKRTQMRHTLHPSHRLRRLLPASSAPPAEQRPAARPVQRGRSVCGKGPASVSLFCPNFKLQTKRHNNVLAPGRKLANSNAADFTSRNCANFHGRGARMCALNSKKRRARKVPKGNSVPPSEV